MLPTAATIQNTKQPLVAHRLWQPVDNIQLVVFRVLFGLVMAGQFVYDLACGWVNMAYVQPGTNITFIGFEWLHVLQGPVMYTYFSCMLLLALMVATGLFYRLSSLLLALLWTAIYLSNKSFYNNHYYLMVLLCWLLAFMPAHRRFSLDVQWRHLQARRHCHQWQPWLFMFQTACVYVFAAIAKMNADWLHAIPLTQWFHQKTGTPIIGPYLRNPLLPPVIAWGGLLLDLLIVPTLLWRRTRLLALMALIGFHAFNGLVFLIGSFPFLALALTVFFFPAEKWKWLTGSTAPSETNMLPRFQPMVKVLMAAYVGLQLLLPLRHWCYPGPVAWTEEGHRLSWQMMLRSKRGVVHFKVTDKANGNAWTVKPQDFLRPSATNTVSVLPDAMWQAAQILKSNYKKAGKDVAVYTISYVSLNYHAPQLLADTTVDLAATSWQPFKHSGWINNVR